MNINNYTKWKQKLQFIRRRVAYTTAEQIRAQHFAIKDQLEVKDEKEKKHALGRMGRDCRWSIWRGLPAPLKTLEHDFGDIKALWRNKQEALLGGWSYI